MLRLPRTLLDPEIAGQYCVDGQVRVSATREHVILDLTSEDEAGEWAGDAEESLSAIVGVRSELAAGDLRPLYLAWLSGYGVWERDEDAFGEEDEDELEPPVPVGLGSLTALQRALADFLRLPYPLKTDSWSGMRLRLARALGGRSGGYSGFFTVPENQRLAGLRSQPSVSGASGGPLSIQAWIG